MARIRAASARTWPSPGTPLPGVPPWCRKSPKINEVLPLLYLHGLSSQDFVPALGTVPG